MAKNDLHASEQVSISVPDLAVYTKVHVYVCIYDVCLGDKGNDDCFLLAWKRKLRTYVLRNVYRCEEQDLFV